MTEKAMYQYVPQDWEKKVRLWALEALKSLEYPGLISDTVRVTYANLNVYVPKQTYVTIRPGKTENYTFVRKTIDRGPAGLFDETHFYKKSVIRITAYGPHSNVVMTYLQGSIADTDLIGFNRDQCISIPSTESELMNVHEDDKNEIIYVWSQDYNVDHTFVMSKPAVPLENVVGTISVSLGLPAEVALLTQDSYILIDQGFILIDNLQ